MSLFTQVIDLKQNFREISDKNFNILSSIISSEVQTLSSPISGYISDGITANFCYDSIEDVNYLQFKDDSDNILYTIDNVNDIGSVEGYIIDQNSGITVRDAINGLSDGANLYDLLANFTGKYAYMTRLKFTDIVEQIRSSNLHNADSLINSLSHGINNDGFIGVQSYFSVIKQYFAAMYDSLESGSPELDTTNPYRCMAIINILVEVVETIFSVLMTVLSGVFRVIGLIVQAIFSFVKNAYSTIQEAQHVTMDMTAANVYVAGPILAWDSENYNYQNLDYGGNVVNVATLCQTESDYESIFMSESRGLAFFAWLPEPHPADQMYQIRCNGYLYPDIDVRTTDWTKIFTRTQAAHNYDAYKFDLNYVNDPDSEYYINLNGEFDAWPRYGAEGRSCPDDGYEAILSIAFTQFLRECSSIKWLNQLGYTQDYLLNDFQLLGKTNSQTGNIDFDKDSGTWKGKLFTILMRLYHYGSYKTWIDTEGSTAIQELDKLADYYSVYLRDEVMKYNQSPVYNLSDFRTVYPWLHQQASEGMTPQFNVYPDTYCILFGLNSHHFMKFQRPGSLTYQWLFSPIDVTSYYKPNCLPAQFGIKLPTISTTELLESLALIGVTMTATAIVSTVVSVKISKMMIGKKTLAGNKISNLKDEFVNDPDNVEKRKAYQNEVFKYNLFGNLFGYGSYDGKNGWFDSSSGESSGLFQNFDEVSAKFNSLEQADYTDHQLLLAIRDLIKRN